MVPAGRWRRLFAFLLDILVCMTLMFVLVFSVAASQTLSFAMVPVHGLVFVAYHFYMHGRSGQTVGKRLVRIRVARSNGAAIGFVGSAKKSLLSFLQSLPWIVAKMMALSQIPPSFFNPVDTKATRVLEQSLMPEWYEWASIVLFLAFVAELVAWFVTKWRQTLSDLIADAVVVNVPEK